jgi:branched-chain amino acid transport system ATP-binding protein
MTSDAALEFDGVSAGYGRIEVLHGVSFSIPRGAIFALLGPNGAGKTTCVRVASGLVAPNEGRVFVGGMDVQAMSAEKLARNGQCCVPEGRAIFPNLSVAENVRMWAYGSRVSRRDVEDQVFARFPLLAQRRKQTAGSLSGGEQQMLAVSRAFATKPQMLLLDELSMGIAPKIVANLYEIIVSLVAEDGLTVLIVEQFAEAALAIATRSAVLSRGEIVFDGEPRDVRSLLSDLYFEAPSSAQLR